MDTQHDFRGWEPARSLLVPHDLSAQADHAAWRAALIARDHGAHLCLLHAADGADAAPARQVLDRLAGELEQTVGVRAEVRIAHGDALQAVLRAARGAGLVVLGAQRTNVLRDWLFGTPAERLLRLCGRPVLVVKKPARSAYRRVLVPVDFGPAAAPAIAAATALSRFARIDVFHSMATRDELTLRAADVPEVVVREYRQRGADRVRTQLAELIGTVPGADLSAAPSVGFGHASGMVVAKEQAMRADLVVIGKRRRGLLADFLLGSVTQRVLATSRSDVLVLPAPRKEPAAQRALGRDRIHA